MPTIAAVSIGLVMASGFAIMLAAAVAVVLNARTEPQWRERELALREREIALREKESQPSTAQHRTRRWKVVDTDTDTDSAEWRRRYQLQDADRDALEGALGLWG